MQVRIIKVPLRGSHISRVEEDADAARVINDELQQGWHLQQTHVAFTEDGSLTCLVAILADEPR